MADPQQQSKATAVATPAPRPRYDYGARSGPSVAAGATASGALPPALDVPRKVYLLGAVFAVLFIYLFRINLHELISLWYTDASWSHGFAVPLLAVAMVYLQWPIAARQPVRGTWAGLALLVFGVASHVLYRYAGQAPMSNLSMLVVLYGAALFILGWEWMKILWLPITFLAFMISPPPLLYARITQPLQNIAAEAGVQLLPLFGVDALRQGTTLLVHTPTGYSPLNVEEACSGIRMLMAFGALAVVLAYTSRRPMWQKAFLAVCAVPVAILCNALRVTLTGAAYVYLGPAWAQGTTHEYLGFVMLIPALGMQLGLAWILDRMFVEVPAPAPAGRSA
jgi:exosortase